MERKRLFNRLVGWSIFTAILDVIDKAIDFIGDGIVAPFPGSWRSTSLVVTLLLLLFLIQEEDGSK